LTKKKDFRIHHEKRKRNFLLPRSPLEGHQGKKSEYFLAKVLEMEGSPETLPKMFHMRWTGRENLRQEDEAPHSKERPSENG